MKCQAVYERALSLLDSITKQGALNVNAEENQEYKVRAPSLIDIIQRELMFDSSNTKIFEVSLPKIKNLLGNNFEEYEYANVLCLKNLVKYCKDIMNIKIMSG